MAKQMAIKGSARPGTLPILSTPDGAGDDVDDDDGDTRGEGGGRRLKVQKGDESLSLSQCRQ